MSTKIYHLCNEYGDAPDKLNDPVKAIGEPVYIKVDKQQNFDLCISKEPFTFSEAKKLEHANGPRIDVSYF